MIAQALSRLSGAPAVHWSTGNGCSFFISRLILNAQGRPIALRPVPCPHHGCTFPQRTERAGSTKQFRSSLVYFTKPKSFLTTGCSRVINPGSLQVRVADLIIHYTLSTRIERLGLNPSCSRRYQHLSGPTRMPTSSLFKHPSGSLY